MIETRNAKILFNKVNATGSCGTALIIPMIWTYEIGIDQAYREIVATFHKDSIIIERNNNDKKLDDKDKARVLRVIFNKSGRGGMTPRISIPKSWIDKLGFTQDDRQAKISLRGDIIIVEKGSI